MPEGFCTAEKLDVPVDSERRCLNDGMPTIPPSYGNRRQTWQDGRWVPEIPKPDGYVWTPKFTDAPEPKQRARKAEVSPALDRLLRPPPPPKPRPERQQQACLRCGKPFTPRDKTIRRQRFCGSVCRASHSAAQKRAEATAARMAETITCAHCGATAPAWQPKGGVRRVYCSEACRKAASQARYQRLPMSARGQTCRGCNRGDRPHRANGLCPNCYARRRHGTLQQREERAS